MENKKVIILGGSRETTTIIYNALKNDLPIESVITENPVSLKILLKQRMRKLGIRTVIGQVLFSLIVPKFLSLTSHKRIQEIYQKYKFDTQSIPEKIHFRVPSVNDDQTIQFLRDRNPNLIIVTGTRIISKRVLESTGAFFINIHVGITPLYRGVHGAYWSLVKNDACNCGVTIHVIDTGIDTGQIIKQAVIKPQKADNFITYPLLQLGEGIMLLKEAAVEIMKGQKKTINPPLGPSKLWYHPTLWQYLKNRIQRGIK